jgi:ribosomal protein S18 acetylase RimI-like enzyme
MNLRKALPSDFIDLIELSKLFETSPFSFDKRMTGLSPNFTPAFAEEMLKKKDTISLVAEDNKEIKGFIAFCLNERISQAAEIKIGNILLLSVNKDYRGRGLGRFLVENAVKLLFNYGANIITVGTDIYNIPAINVYEECGFRTRFCWHIFRYYRDFGTSGVGLQEEIELLNPYALDKFKLNFNRPVSLLYEKSVNKEILRDYLFEGFRRKILKGETISLQYEKNGKSVAMINIIKDELANKSLGGSVVIYRICDLIVLDEAKGEGIETLLLKDTIARLHDFSAIEIWTSVEDTELINGIERAGFELSYTGVSLHLNKK